MSAVSFTLNAQARTDEGKGASRRLRRLEAKLPAVIYGGKEPAQSITLELRELVKALENEAFYSHVLTINIDGKPQQAVIKALQRHPAKNQPLHSSPSPPLYLPHDTRNDDGPRRGKCADLPRGAALDTSEAEAPPQHRRARQPRRPMRTAKPA